MDHWRVFPAKSAFGWSGDQFTQIAHNQIRAMPQKLVGIPFARHPDHERKLSARTGLHSGEGVFDDAAREG
jgi:hypothetical protein